MRIPEKKWPNDVKQPRLRLENDDQNLAQGSNLLNMLKLA